MCDLYVRGLGIIISEWHFSHIYNIYKTVVLISSITVRAIFYMNNNCQMNSSLQSKFRLMQSDKPGKRFTPFGLRIAITYQAF